jgi:uncharacterized delta-60 repeat protein
LRPYDAPDQLFVDEAGSVVLCGERWVQRRLADGGLDPSFGEDGTATAPDGENMVSCAPTDSGGVLSVIELVTPDLHQVKVFKVDENGVPDEGFGRHGVRRAAIPPEVADLGSAGIQLDGSVVLGGHTTDFSMAIVRLTPRARLDPSFGDDGLVTVPLDDEAEATFVDADSEGRVVAVGSKGGTGTAVRLTATGEPDVSFATDGVFHDPDSDGVATDGRIDAHDRVLALIQIPTRTPEGNVGFLRLLG